MGELHNRAGRTVRRRELRRNSTGPEHLLWAKLRANQLGVKFRRQHSIGPYIVDFYAAEARLVIELDGDSHYADIAAREYDLVRDQYLRHLGIETLRFSNDDVMRNRDGVLALIQTVIARQPPPQPSP